MKRKLPQSYTEAIVLFPKNLRLITECTFSEKQSHIIKVILVSVVSLFLIALIFFQGVAIWDNLKVRNELIQQRQQLQNEAKYWEGVSGKYQGYRDVYYRIAALEYRLGNISESQKYVKKALELDPNFSQGRVLGATVGL